MRPSRLVATRHHPPAASIASDKPHVPRRVLRSNCRPRAPFIHVVPTLPLREAHHRGTADRVTGRSGRAPPANRRRPAATCAMAMPAAAMTQLRAASRCGVQAPGHRLVARAPAHGARALRSSLRVGLPSGERRADGAIPLNPPPPPLSTAPAPADIQHPTTDLAAAAVSLPTI